MTRYVLFLILFYLFPTFIFMLNKNSVRIKNYFNRIFYVSSVEKQNTLSYNNFKNITPIKKKKKQFILLKKKNDNVYINICRLQKKKKNNKIEQNLYMLNHNNNYQNEINNNKKDINNNNNNIYQNNKNANVKREHFYSNFPGNNDDGNYFNSMRKKKKKKRKLSCNLKKSNEDTENLRRNQETNENNKFRSNNNTATNNTATNNTATNNTATNNTATNNTATNNTATNNTATNNTATNNTTTTANNNNNNNSQNKVSNYDNNEKKNKVVDEFYENYKEINEGDRKIDKKKLEDINEENIRVINEENNSEIKDEDPTTLINKYLKDEKLLSNDKNLKNIDKKKVLDEYNRLVQLLKESAEKRSNQFKENEKKDIYELNERVINSSSKLNIEKLKKEIDKNFKVDDIMEKKIQNYIHLFTQDVGSNCNNDDYTNSENENNSHNIDRENVEESHLENEVEKELIKEDEEKMNKKILKELCKGDYSNVDKFNFKLSKKDFKMMNNMDDEKDVSEEEKKLIDEVFNKIQNDKSFYNKINEKEKKVLELYEKQKKENKTKRCEELENLIYYNKRIQEENKKFKNNNQNEKDIINKNIFFNNPGKFVEIKEEEIAKMSESQMRDELRKRGYPTFGSLEIIRRRLLDVMKIKENHQMDIRKIIKNPDENILSHIKLKKLKENIKEYNERDKCGDIDSKMKQIDSAIEISNFLNDPIHYLRIDTSNKFIKQYDNNMQSNNMFNEPIVNDRSFDEEISMAEKLKKTFNFQNEEKLPDKIKKFGNEDENTDEFNEEKEEIYRKNVLKYGGLQETIDEFHYKHNLSLDFIGDFICKMCSASIQEINKYRYKTKEEIKNLEENEFESFISQDNLNNDFVVYKFVDTTDLIKNYLTTKDIVALIEYSNIADPVDIIHYYSPETLFMLSEEYNITINHIIDACTKLNIKLPYGGDTHLNMTCFNALTTYLCKYEKLKK